MNRATMLHHQAHLMAGQVYDGHILSAEEEKELRAAMLYIVAAISSARSDRFSELTATIHMEVFNGKS